MNYAVDMLIAVCALALAFFFAVLFALLRDMSRVSRLSADSAEDRRGRGGIPIVKRQQRGGPASRKKQTWAAALAIGACMTSMQRQPMAFGQSCAHRVRTDDARTYEPTAERKGGYSRPHLVVGTEGS